MYSKLKKILNQELNNLKQAFPLKNFSNVELKCYKDSDYYRLSGKKGRDAQLFYDLKSINNAHILLCVDGNEVLSQVEDIVVDIYNIKRDIHLYFFMLYHEYGHLFYIDRTLKKYGLGYVENELSYQKEEIALIKKQIDDGEITIKKGQMLYRKTKIEKKADDFAVKYYKKMTSHIDQCVNEIKK